MVRRFTLVCLLLAGCGPLVTDGGAGGTDAGEQSGGTTGPGGTSAASATPPPVDPDATGSTTVVPPATTAADESSSESGVAFLIKPDWDGPTIECSVWDQDCPPGEKCTAWAHDGGESWNATRCVPIADDAGQAGDPCTVEGAPTSGLDDCDLGHMCWSIDPATGEGRCVPLCTGAENNPICEDPDLACPLSAEPVLTLCLPRCDPLAQSCLDHEGCFEILSVFVCVPHGEGQYGEPCEYANGCEAGLACTEAADVPGCADTWCCSPYCDVTAENACPGEGQECVATPEPGYENLGRCGIP